MLFLHVIKPHHLIHIIATKPAVPPSRVTLPDRDSSSVVAGKKKNCLLFSSYCLSSQFSHYSNFFR